jgi:hypothetical protein
LTGLSDTRKLDFQSPVLLYGFRPDDTKRRLVGVAVTNRDAGEVMDLTKYIGTMPAIEVEDQRWFYVALLGDGRTVFVNRKEPQ